MRPVPRGADHSSGNVAVLRRQALQRCPVFSYRVNRARSVQQSVSHPHAVIFDPSRRCYRSDKGFDCTFIFRFEGGRLALTGASVFWQRLGTAFSTVAVLYVNNELD